MNSSFLTSTCFLVLLGVAAPCARSAILFTGPFAPGAWTQSVSIYGGLSFNTSTLVLSSPNGNLGVAAESKVTITIPQSGTLSFSYSGSTMDGGWYFDPVGYRVGGATTALSPDSESDALPFSGTASVPVVGGVLFSFYAASAESAYGAGTLTITDFDFVPVPEPSTYALLSGIGLLGFGLVRRSQARV